MIRILTIADNNDDLTVIKTYIYEAFPYTEITSSLSHELTVSGNPTGIPDLIILSINSNTKDGLIAWQRFKTLKLWKQIPLVLIIPDESDIKLQARSLEIKAEADITVPYDFNDIKDQVSALLQIRKSKELATAEKSQLEELVKIRTRELEAELESRKETEKQLLLINQELEAHKLATLNLLEDLRIEIDERTNAQQMLHNSEELLRMLINAMPDIVCFKDGEGRWLEANEFDLKLFGLTEVDYRGKKDSELAAYSEFYREALLNCELTDEEAWLRGVPSRGDEVIPRKGASPLIFDIIKIPGFHKNGTRKSLVIVGREITERKAAEAELQKLSQAVQQSPDSIIVTDINGIIEYVNPAACSITGYSMEELIGKNPNILGSGETSTDEYKQMWDTINSGREWKGEFHNRRKNGELYWEGASISPIKNARGEITHFLGIKGDITDKKNSDISQKVLFNISKKVFESNDVTELLDIVKQELNAFMDTSNLFVALYDQETGMLSSAYGNDDADDITSWPAEKSLTGYVIKNNKSLLVRQADFKKLLASGEVELIGSDSEVWLGVPLLVEGNPFGALVIQDYHNPNAYGDTELKMFEFIASQMSISIQRQKSMVDLKEALVKAEAGDRLKTAFINNISHEIRTPLNGILGFSEMTLNPDSTPEDNEMFYSIIKKSSKRLLNTITSYMDISMIVSGTMEIVHRATNLEKLLDELYYEINDICLNKNVELIKLTDTNPEPLVLNTDLEKLRKILSHLLDNAVKFTTKGSITFGYILKSDEIEFFIKDTGTGIKAEAIDVIFNAFMQADVSPTRGYEGSGLGLTIANGMVKHLGGNLWVDSERGKGSSFYFTLPLSENPMLVSRKIVDTSRKKSETKPLILVAEDDDSNYKYIEIVLQYASFEVVRAENGYEAVEICRSNPNVCLVLMDIKMPLMDGFESTRIIKAMQPKLPVIALTAHVTTEDENAAIAAGCNEYVTKPVSKSRLLEIIESSLNINH